MVQRYITRFGRSDDTLNIELEEEGIQREREREKERNTTEDRKRGEEEASPNEKDESA